jgi:hypothetical protein
MPQRFLELTRQDKPNRVSAFWQWQCCQRNYGVRNEARAHHTLKNTKSAYLKVSGSNEFRFTARKVNAGSGKMAVDTSSMSVLCVKKKTN